MKFLIRALLPTFLLWSLSGYTSDPSIRVESSYSEQTDESSTMLVYTEKTGRKIDKALGDEIFELGIGSTSGGEDAVKGKVKFPITDEEEELQMFLEIQSVKNEQKEYTETGMSFRYDSESDLDKAIDSEISLLVGYENLPGEVEQGSHYAAIGVKEVLGTYNDVSLILGNKFGFHTNVKHRGKELAEEIKGKSGWGYEFELGVKYDNDIVDVGVIGTYGDIGYGKTGSLDTGKYRKNKGYGANIILDIAL